MWSQEKISKQKQYFEEQRNKPTGNFTELVVRTYYCIYKFCVENDSNCCIASKTNSYKIKNIIYEGFYNNHPDHDYRRVIDNCKDTLKEMHYIRLKKENDIWMIYILQPLDFLLEGEHESYLKKYEINNTINFQLYSNE